MVEKAKKTCPECQSCEIVPVVAPLVGFEVYDAEALQKMPVAECVESGEEGRYWECKNCGYRWGGAEENRQAKMKK